MNNFRTLAPVGGTGSGTRAAPAAGPHLLAAGLVLAGCLALPRPGTETVLLPLGRSAPLAVALSLAPGARVVGPARLGRGLVVHFPGAVPVLALIRGGVIPVAATPILCGSAPATASTPPEPGSPR
jgi:hypothetical protein